MPGATTVSAPSGTSKYDAIPGPLGLASASLEGKVALVTGAGKSKQHVQVHNSVAVACAAVRGYKGHPTGHPVHPMPAPDRG